MNEEQERDQDPEPIKHADAERVTSEEADKVPKGDDAASDDDETQ